MLHERCIATTTRSSLEEAALDGVAHRGKACAYPQKEEGGGMKKGYGLVL